MFEKFGFFRKRSDDDEIMNEIVDLAFKTPKQAMFELQRGEIVCFLSDDKAESIKMFDDELLIYYEGEEECLKKVIKDNEELFDLISGFMELTYLYKNGALFKVK